MILPVDVGRRVKMNVSGKSVFYADRLWYHPFALARRIINYYLVICVGLFLLQNSLLFPRWMTGAVLSREEAAMKAADVGLIPSDQALPGKFPFQGYVRSDFSLPDSRGTIVVFHGNAGCTFDRGDYVDAFAQRGF